MNMLSLYTLNTMMVKKWKLKVRNVCIHILNFTCVNIEVNFFSITAVWLLKCLERE